MLALLFVEQISAAFQKFGIGDGDQRLIIAQIHMAGMCSIGEVCEQVCGEMVPLSRLNDFASSPDIQKVIFGLR